MQLLDRPRLRLYSGKEVPIEVPLHCTFHEFYQLARAALNLERNISLVLLRAGLGRYEDRQLPCHRWEAGHLIRRKRFDVITHK